MRLPPKPPRSSNQRVQSHSSRRPGLWLMLLALVAASLFVMSSGGRVAPQPAAWPAAAAVAPGPPVEADKPVLMLVMGVDERPDDPGRSDTAMVVRLDPRKKEVTVLAIPRDSRVQIPGHGWDKFGHAYAYGGPSLSLRTASNLVGRNIPYYAIVNFQGFKNIVNLLGGVSINVEKPMKYDDPYDTPPLHIDIKRGLQVLDGQQALHFVRFRHDEVGDDIGRIRRTQQFLHAVAQGALRPWNLVRLPWLVPAAARSVRTNVRSDDLSRLALWAYQARAHIQGAAVPGKGQYIDDISYWVVDKQGLQALAASW